MRYLKYPQQIGPGYYLNWTKLELELVENVRFLRPSDGTYVHIAVPLLLILAPLAGFLFALFLPALGFVMPLWALFCRAPKEVECRQKPTTGVQISRHYNSLDAKASFP